MAVQIEDIVNQEFSRSFLGYDIQEVDVFLDTLIDRIDKLESQRRELILAMEYLLKKLEHNGELSEGVKRTLSSSDRALRRLIAAAEQPAHDARAAGKAAKERPIASDSRKDRRAPTAEASARTGKTRKAAQEPKESLHPQEAAGAAASDAVGNETPRIDANQPATKSVGMRSPFRVGHFKSAEATGAQAGRKPDVFQSPVVIPETEPDAVPDAQSAPVAIEMEIHDAGDDASELDLLIPELMSDLESALSDEAIRSASDIARETIVRAGEGRVL